MHQCDPAGQLEASGIVNTVKIPSSNCCNLYWEQTNGMQAQSQVHRRLTYIHQARGGEQDPAGKAQAVKDSRQRGVAASTARRQQGCHSSSGTQFLERCKIPAGVFRF